MGYDHHPQAAVFPEASFSQDEAAEGIHPCPVSKPAKVLSDSIANLMFRTCRARDLHQFLD